MDVYAKIAQNIIEQQELIIGPVAVEQAQLVEGLLVDWSKRAVSFTINPATVINNLVKQYKELFGQISVEVCKEAASKFAQQLTPEQLPESLK